MRSVAVIVSAIVARTTSIRSDVCDNAAGIVVGLTIGMR